MDRNQHLDADPRATDGGELVAEAERLTARAVPEQGRRVRLRTRLVTEERQITVTVQREELVVDHLDAEGRSLGEPTPVRGGAAVQRGTEAAAELVLHREEVEVVKKVVPSERVRVFVDRMTTEQRVTENVSREQIEVDDDRRLLRREPGIDGRSSAR